MFAKHVRPNFKEIKAIFPEFLVSTSTGVANNTITAGSTAYSIGANFHCTLACTADVMYFNPLVTCTTANGYRLDAGDTIDLKVENTLSLIGNSTTAKAQAIIWQP